MKEILNYKEFGNGPALLILHGLFGSLDNWQTLAKKFGEQFRCITVDLRNHGRSFHSDRMDYPALAGDVLFLLNELQIPKAHLLGHSMGGKTAMQLALNNPEVVQSLIVSDITPSAYADKHSDVIKALQSAPLHSDNRNEVSEFLMNQLEGDAGTVMFLMKGLQRKEGNAGFEWKFNLNAISASYSKLSGEVTGSKAFEGNSLFIKGSRSGYIVPATYSSITDWFPHHQLEEIKDAGHWIHADQPEAFLQCCVHFLSEQ